MKQQPDTSNLPLLKNGKPHVSYSEVSVWKGCSWRHKLIYVDGLSLGDKSPYLDYGSIVHEAVELYLKGNPIDLDAVELKLREAWLRQEFDTETYVSSQTRRAEAQGWNYRHENIGSWVTSARTCLQALPAFLDSRFPGWKPVATEHLLYENIADVEYGVFKGFIDSVIELPNGKHVILDWKTAGPRGWLQDKKRDFNVLAQLFLYKNYWMKLTGKSSRDVQTHFVLLKRNTKLKSAIDIVSVCGGPTAVEKANKMVVSMVKSMQRGMAIKNRNSCQFCEFKNTPNCT
jgi:hypothetical protein